MTSFFQLNDVQTTHDLIQKLTIATGGNYLLNIGPDHNGRILPVFEERLVQLGDFVDTHEVFSSKPWIYQNVSTTWYPVLKC